MRDDPILKSLLPTFAQELRARLDEIEAALARADVTTVAAVCHKAGGSAATFGFSELAMSIQRLEASARGAAPTGELLLLCKALRRLGDSIIREIAAT